MSTQDSPTSTDWRAELQRLVQAYDDHGGKWPDEDVEALYNAFTRARATLAQPELRWWGRRMTSWEGSSLIGPNGLTRTRIGYWTGAPSYLPPAPSSPAGAAPPSSRCRWGRMWKSWLSSSTSRP